MRTTRNEDRRTDSVLPDHVWWFWDSCHFAHDGLDSDTLPLPQEIEKDQQYRKPYNLGICFLLDRDTDIAETCGKTALKRISDRAEPTGQRRSRQLDRPSRPQRQNAAHADVESLRAVAERQIRD